LPSPSTPDLGSLISRARAADGQPPFSDQSLVDLRTGSRRLLTVDDGVAIIGTGEAELLVDPDARGRGRGTALLEAVLADTTGDIRIWSHGDHPAARALAASHGFAAVRTLLQLENVVPSVEPVEPAEALGVFVVGRDEDEWVALNARTFAFHAEQGSVTRSDLEELEGEDWFRADDFIVARQDGRMVGYNWLKIEPDQTAEGEIYVIGVDPDIQHSGLGRRLMTAGYARLDARGIRTVHLYVEGDNAPAVALYRSLGFTDRAVDIQYLLSR
jgi:mycothiol synthase